QTIGGPLVPRIKVDIKDFLETLEDIGTHYPNLKTDDRFVLWFLHASVVDSEERAAEAVTGGASDKGIDAVLIDERARAVVIVQGRFHQSIGEMTEKLADVMLLAHVVDWLAQDDDAEFREYLSDMNVLGASRLREARKCILQEGYRLWLYFVT